MSSGWAGRETHHKVVAAAKRLRSALDRKMGFFLDGDGPTLYSSAAVPQGGSLVSPDLRGVGGIPPDARGLVLMVRVLDQTSNRDLCVDSADAPNMAPNSPRHRATTVYTSGQYWVPLGASASRAGKIRLSARPDEAVSGVSVWATGWWT